MQAYSVQHKAVGVKAVLAKCNVSKLTDATPEQLAWINDVFKSGAAV